MYLPDTNACIGFLKNRRAVVERWRERDPQDIRLCAPIKAELLYGARKSQRTVQNLAILERFLAPYLSLPFDDRCAEEYGLIRADLARAGRPIGAGDLFIAAIAIAHDLTLVTHNTGEFSRVAGLKLEDWEQDEAP